MIRPVPGGVELRLHVQPRAARTELVCTHGTAVKIRIAAPPVEGAANAELIHFLAELFEVPRSRVELRAGNRGRRKTVLIRQVTLESARRALSLHG